MLAPSQIIGGGACSSWPHPLPTPMCWCMLNVRILLLDYIDYRLDQVPYSEISARNLPTVCFLTLLSGLYGSQMIIEIYTG